MFALYLINTLATIAIAVAAWLAFGQWKKEFHGKDIYKSLIDLKINFLQFHNHYNGARISFIKQPSKLDDKEYDMFTKLFDRHRDALWKNFEKLEYSLNYYKILNCNDLLFLDQEIREVYDLIDNYRVSASLYVEYKSNPTQYHQVTAHKCEKYLIKSANGEDEVSQEIKSLKAKAFEKLDAKIEFFLNNKLYYRLKKSYKKLSAKNS